MTSSPNLLLYFEKQRCFFFLAVIAEVLQQSTAQCFWLTEKAQYFFCFEIGESLLKSFVVNFGAVLTVSSFLSWPSELPVFFLFTFSCLLNCGQLHFDLAAVCGLVKFKGIPEHRGAYNLEIKMQFYLHNRKETHCIKHDCINHWRWWLLYVTTEVATAV